MSIITLTDRISVSVRAKNNTEKSAQNKATGANIQKALGGSELSDADLEEIGNVDSITDEHGNEWIKMEDIIAAGRKMKEKGAFAEEKEKYTIKNSSKSFYKVSYVKLWNVDKYKNPPSNYSFVEYSGDVYINAFKGSNGSISYVVCDGCPSASSSPKLISKTTYYSEDSSKTTTSIAGEQTSRMNINNPSLVFPDNTYYASDSDIRSALNRNNYSKETSGGSLIDWDAPNAEVERQIKELHETWDVSEHPGASGQGVGAGTYILAGPIEFNDGD